MRAEWLPAMAHRRMGGRATSCATGVSWASAGVILFGGARAIFARTPLLAWRSTTAAARKLATIAHVMMRPISAGTDAVQGELHRRYPTVPSHRCVTPEGWVEAPRRPSRPSAGSGYHVPPGDGSHPGRGPNTTTVDGSWSKKPGGAGWTLAALDGDHLGTKAPGPDVSARERIEHVGGRAGHEDE